VLILGEWSYIVPELERKHKVMIVVILIVFALVILSFVNAWSMVYPRAYGDPTPNGAILKVTATPDSKILVALGVFSPWVRYADCGIILVPPGDQGGNSSGQAKLLWIVDQGRGSYNSTIRLEILLFNASGSQDLNSRHFEINDSLIINCSMMGHIPEGRWSIYLMFYNGTMAMASWRVNETPMADQSLSFARTGDADPMLDYGLIQAPQFWEYGEFWGDVLAISSISLVILIVVLGTSLKYDSKDKRT
jgi:hypothetical protein